MLRLGLACVFCACSACLGADEPAASGSSESAVPKAVWSITSGLDSPKTAYYDEATKLIFISNVAGAPLEKDGKGWITKAGADGKVVDAQWVKGLNAPKGLRIHKGMLWIADIDTLVAVEVATGQIKQRVAVPGAKGLSGIALDDEGTLYVADMLTNKIHQLRDGKLTLFAEGDTLEHPNGLLIHDGLLVVAGWGDGLDAKTLATKSPGHLFSLEIESKKKELIGEQPLGNLDGLELDGNGGYFVTDYAGGKLYRVSAEGDRTLLFADKPGLAGLGVVTARLLLVPRLPQNTLTAYDLDDLPQ